MNLARMPDNRYVNLDHVVHVFPITRGIEGQEVVGYKIRLVNGDELTFGGDAGSVAGFTAWLDDLAADE